MGCGIPFAEAYNWVYTTVGVHPHDASKVEGRHFETMGLLANHPRVLAIGETGLDYHYDNSPRDVQREVFRRQLEMAAKTDLPVIIHTREADADTERILRAAGPVRGVIHCFTSSRSLADAALELGFLISLSGIATFPNARDLAEIAATIPADRLLVETDCPYLPPHPHRGQRNEPAHVRLTATRLAEIHGVPLERIEQATTENAKRLFPALPVLERPAVTNERGME